jgi:hypothetical protein
MGLHAIKNYEVFVWGGDLVMMDEIEESLDYWRLCDELSIFQAALLTIGVNPSGRDGAYCEMKQPHEQPHGYEAAKTAISNALRRGAV